MFHSLCPVSFQKNFHTLQSDQSEQSPFWKNILVVQSREKCEFSGCFFEFSTSQLLGTGEISYSKEILAYFHSLLFL